MSRRADRPTARVDLSYLKALQDQQSQGLKGDDNQCLLPATTARRRPRVTEARLGQIAQGLSDRDRAILVSLKRFRLATTGQLQRLHFATHASPDTASRVARRVLARLHDQQLVIRRHGVFPKVLWSAPTIERCQQIAEFIAAHGDIEPRLFDIALAEQAIEVLTDFTDDQGLS